MKKEKYNIDDFIDALKNINPTFFQQKDFSICKNTSIFKRPKTSYFTKHKCDGQCDKCSLFLHDENSFKFELLSYIIHDDYYKNQDLLMLLENAVCFRKCDICPFSEKQGCIFRQFKEFHDNNYETAKEYILFLILQTIKQSEKKLDSKNLNI